MSLFSNLFRRRGLRPGRARAAADPVVATSGRRAANPICSRILREEILAAITKHVTVERDNVQVRMDRGTSVSTLEIDVEIPHSAGMLLAAGS